MSKGLELYQSRVSRVDHAQGTVTIHFPHAYIYQAKGLPGRDPGSSWSQEVELLLDDASIAQTTTSLPNMIDDGYFEVDGVRHEVIPLPLGEHGSGHLHLTFSDGSELDIHGKHPVIKLLGKAKRLEDFL
ncbi:MAG TPA: hypothetical protein VGE50_04205 [Gammaproteobacteria bacterium]